MIETNPSRIQSIAEREFSNVGLLGIEYGEFASTQVSCYAAVVAESTDGMRNFVGSITKELEDIDLSVCVGAFAQLRLSKSCKFSDISGIKGIVEQLLPIKKWGIVYGDMANESYHLAMFLYK